MGRTVRDRWSKAQTRRRQAGLSPRTFGSLAFIRNLARTSFFLRIAPVSSPNTFLPKSVDGIRNVPKAWSPRNVWFDAFASLEHIGGTPAFPRTVVGRDLQTGVAFGRELSIQEVRARVCTSAIPAERVCHLLSIERLLSDARNKLRPGADSALDKFREKLRLASRQATQLCPLRVVTAGLPPRNVDQYLVHGEDPMARVVAHVSPPREGASSTTLRW